MICPYCQHDLEVETLSCPRCFAEYPRTSRPFGFGLRVTAAASAMLFVSTLIVVQCVVAYLPGGKHARLSADAKIFSGGTATNFKSAEVNELLARWASHQQNSEMKLPAYNARK
jgi:hypothetical protein